MSINYWRCSFSKVHGSYEHACSEVPFSLLFWLESKGNKRLSVVLPFVAIFKFLLLLLKQQGKLPHRNFFSSPYVKQHQSLERLSNFLFF